VNKRRSGANLASGGFTTGENQPTMPRLHPTMTRRPSWSVPVWSSAQQGRNQPSFLDAHVQRIDPRQHFNSHSFSKRLMREKRISPLISIRELYEIASVRISSSNHKERSTKLKIQPLRRNAVCPAT
jgi:hypothetical protein